MPGTVLGAMETQRKMTNSPAASRRRWYLSWALSNRVFQRVAVGKERAVLRMWTPESDRFEYKS